MRTLVALLAAAALVLGGCATQGTEGSGGSAGQTSGSSSDQRERAQTHLELATGYFQNGQYQIALSESQIAMRIDPGFSDAWDMAGTAYLTLGDPGQARTHFQRALSIHKDSASAMHNMGWLECELGNHSAAEQWFQRALDAPNVNRSGTLLAQGICQARAGQGKQAEETLLQAYEFDPGNPITGYNLALLLYQHGDYERARFYIRRLNNSELANAESLWLGIKVEYRLSDGVAMRQLGNQLRRRFADAPELLAYEQGRFDD